MRPGDSLPDLNLYPIINDSLSHVHYSVNISMYCFTGYVTDKIHTVLLMRVLDSQSAGGNISVQVGNAPTVTMDSCNAVQRRRPLLSSAPATTWTSAGSVALARSSLVRGDWKCTTNNAEAEAWVPKSAGWSCYVIIRQLTGRLHGTIVGPTGRFDWCLTGRSDRPVGRPITLQRRRYLLLTS